MRSTGRLLGLLLALAPSCAGCVSESLHQKAIGDDCLVERDIDGAVRAYTMAIAADPENAEAYAARGYALHQLGRLSEAMEDYDSALVHSHASARIYINRALARRELLNAYLFHADSILRDPVAPAVISTNRVMIVWDLTRAIEAEHANILAYEMRGEALLDFGMYEDAEKDFSAMLTLSPDDPWAYNERGRARYERGDLQGAIHDYTEAIRWGGEQTWSLYNRGVARQEAGSYKEAIDDFSRAAELDSSDLWTWYQRGLCRFGLGDSTGGWLDIRRADSLGNLSASGKPLLP